MAIGFLRAAARRLKEHRYTIRGNTPLPPVILCADDDDSVRALCAAVLARAGFRTDTARNGREALERIHEQEYAAILLDLDMPYVHGATVLALLAREQPRILRRLIIMTALPSVATNDFEGSVGATLRKPVRNDELVAAVRSCCEAPDVRPAPVAAAIPVQA